MNVKLSELMDRSLWLQLIWNERRRIKGNREYRLFDDESFIKKYYLSKFGSEVRLDNPQTFNEKLNWLKLNYKNELATKCADKYEVREYIEQKGYSHLLNKLIDVYEDVNEIDIYSLPERFVLKATHGSGWNLIVKDKKQLNWKVWKLIINSWMKQNYYIYGREWVYKNIKPRIVCEQYLEDKKGELLDYKILCFNGKPKLIQVDIDRFQEHARNIYNTNWEKIGLTIEYPSSNKDIKKPDNLDEMLKICKDLAEDFPHVRVDFYEVDGTLYFGELTFFHEGGQGRINPKQYDKIMGDWIDLSIIKDNN